jgi:hypothetical protein
MNELEAQLHALASGVRFPLTPDFSARSWGSPARGRSARRVRIAVVLAALAVPAASLALSGDLRDRLARWLGFDPGIERVPQLPKSDPVPSLRPAAPLAPGSVVSLRRARDLAGFPLLVPPGVGAPSRVYLAGSGTTAQVTLVWSARDGLPAVRGSDVGLLLSERRGSAPMRSQKLIGPGSKVRQVQVGDANGLTVVGPDHVIEYFDQRYAVQRVRPRLSGNALLWGRDGIILRAEAALDSAALVRLAESLR